MNALPNFHEYVPDIEPTPAQIDERAVLVREAAEEELSHVSR